MARHFKSLASLMLLAVCWHCSGPPGVRPGIDVLLTDSLHLITGQRLGILTNQTGVDADGVGDVERLLAAGAQVTAIFSPEHGYRGVLDRDSIGHGLDSATGIPIYSLYGPVREPPAETLAGMDVLLVDLQDIGARAYTYISTTLLAMRAASDIGVPVIVLDRPNPIGGVHVEGPVLDTLFRSFVGMLAVPLRHGMTLGELALFGNETLGIGSALTVIPAANWSRGLWYDGTALPWVRPSPNMPDLESATHYPGMVLFEGTNLSVGRGTPIAFQVVGAPWLDPAAVRRSMEPPGVSVVDTVVTPVEPPDGKYGGLAIPALRLRLADRESYRPTLAAVALLTAIRAVHGDSLRFRNAAFDQLAGGDRLRLAVQRGESAEEIVVGWEVGVAEFRRVRARYLLYR